MRKGRKPGLSYVLSLLPLVSRRDLRPPKTYLQKKKKTSCQHAEPHHWRLRSRGTDLAPGCGMLLHSHSFCPEDVHLLSVPLYFQCYQHTLSCTRLCRPEYPPATSLMLWWKGKISSGTAQEPRPDCCRKGTTGWAPLVMLPVATAQLDIAGKGLCFLRLILHRKISPLCTHTQSKLLLPLLQLVFEEIPWEALKGKKRAPGVDCNRWKLNMTESFNLF